MNAINIIRIEDILDSEFEEVNWIVRDLLPPGVSLLTGKPKQGKSWLVHAMGLHVAAGRPVFGMASHQSSVLYMALEDSKRRLKDRTDKLMRSHGISKADISGKFLCTTEAPMMGEGLEEQISSQLENIPDLRLVIIDVLQRVRPGRRPNQSIYQYDYQVGEHLKMITAKHPCLSIIIVHHARKGAGDALDSVSGTNGLAGGMDNAFSIHRGSDGLELRINARDIEDSRAIPLIKGDDQMFTLSSRKEAWERRSSDSRKKIIKALQSGLTAPKQIADDTELSIKTVEGQLKRLVKRGRVERRGRGEYILTDRSLSDCTEPSYQHGVGEGNHVKQQDINDFMERFS